MKPIIFILVVLIGLLQYQLWFAPGGLVSAYELHQSIQHQEEANQKLSSRNSQVELDINDLKNGNEAAEERARNDLGMVKKGEIFYQVVK